MSKVKAEITLTGNPAKLNNFKLVEGVVKKA